MDKTSGSRQIYRRFVYRPLEAGGFTRVLCLSPAADPDDDLQCRLETIGRDDFAFEPVSYTWGRSEFSKTLYHGKEKIAVTDTVDSMLRQLRQVDRERRLWIDAICINQSDNGEKATQVERMHRIYKDRHVLVWLGDGYWYGADVLRFLGSLKDDSSFEVEPHDFSEPFDYDGKYSDLFYNDESWLQDKMAQTAMTKQLTSPESHSTSANPDEHSSLQFRLALAAFFERPWFYRRWILQEMACAATGTVICGGSTLPLDEFVLTSFILVYKYSVTLGFQMYTSETVRSMFYLRSTYQFQRPAKQMGLLDRSNAERPGQIRQQSSDEEGYKDILWLLNSFWMSDCKDPRDRIYALLGLSRDARRKNERSRGRDRRDLMEIPISYEVDCGIVYQNFAQAYIKYFGHSSCAYTLLQCAAAFSGQPKVKSPNWPSWIPDWSAGRRFVPFTAKHVESGNYVPSSRETSSSYISFAGEAQTMLRIRGTLIGKLQVVSPFNWRPDQADPAFRFAIKCIELKLNQEGALLSDRNALKRTAYQVVDLLTGQGLDLASDHDTPQPWITQSALNIKHFDKLESNSTLCMELISELEGGLGYQGRLSPGSGIRGNSHLPALTRILEVCKGRAFGITSSGITGLCPEKSAEGDWLVMFNGASTPFMLRPNSSNRFKDDRPSILQTFHLVGDSWTGDEVLDRGLPAQERKDPVFVLR